MRPFSELRRRIPLVVLTLAVWFVGGCFSLRPTTAAPPTPTAEGLRFDAQMSAALAAYQNGDRAEGRRLLEQFRLPESAKWFAEQFGAENGEALSKRYDRLFESYVNSTEKHLEDVASTKGRTVRMNLRPGTSEPPDSGKHTGPVQLSGVVPAQEPTCFNVSFSIVLAANASLFSGDFKAEMWMDTFVYQGGAFRFLGHGAWPFWVWKDRPEGLVRVSP
jgi:hypothetical protein